MPTHTLSRAATRALLVLPLVAASPCRAEDARAVLLDTRAQGHRVREVFVEGGDTCLVAVQQDASGSGAGLHAPSAEAIAMATASRTRSAGSELAPVEPSRGSLGRGGPGH